MNTNPFSSEQRANITLETICNQIDKVVKSPTIKNGETGIYHIFIANADISINTSQLTQGPGRFRTLYFDTFGKLPYIPKESWPVFVEYIAGIAEPGEYEETAALMAADLLFEEMVNTFQLTKDREVLLNRDNCLYFVEHKPHDELFYVVPSATVTSMLNEIRIKATLEDVSAAMVARGYKAGNTHTVKVTGTNVRCWWFQESAIEAAMPVFKAVV
ncbi:MAG: hypothetical protein PWP63_80 [Methanolobus sp.]|nr:hypothetical protein [Methanolobus sp.]